MITIPRLLKDPLLHFLVLGGGLFLLYAWTADEAPPDPGKIVISSGRIQNLAGVFERTHRRPPTPQELEGIVNDFIREEVV